MAQSAPNRSRGNGGKPPRQRRRGKVALVWFICIAVLAVLAAAVAYLLVILNGERVLSANLNKLDLDRSTIVADAEGKQIAKISIAGGNREYVQYKDIPQAVRDAFVAVEDKRFYEHGGVDLFGIGRALAKDVVARSMVEGASTITQQLARNLFLNADKTWFRKGTEASIALALERHKTKEEILELYLNRIYFGNGQYGIKTAAKFYFGVGDLDQLKTWQIATLAAIPKGPSVYNPYKHPDNSMERRAVVLRLMTDQGLITEEERAAAAAIVYKPTMAMTNTSKFASYTDYAIDEALEKLGLSEEELLSGGYTIYTTIDTQAQTAAESAFSDDDNFEESKDDISIQGAMVIMDQHDGSLKAMVGGRDYQKSGLNRVESRRQPGSSFKPIVSYGPALETGDYTPDSTLRDDKVCYNNGKYCPKDSNKNPYVGAIAMKDAIKGSINQPAVWLLNEIGVSTGVKFAGKLGIELDKDDRNLAIALGGLTRGVTPVEMVRAYGAFANGGQLQDAHAVLKITDAAGKTVYSFKEPKDNQVMKPMTSYYVTEIMKGVVSGGTGTKAQISGRTVAGKTGTTQLGLKGASSSGNRDVWFVGFTPEYTAAVWMGYDKTDTTHYVRNSSGQAAAMFSRVMKKALEGKEKLAFPVPQQAEEQPTPTRTPDSQAIADLSGVYDSQQVAVALNWSAVPGDDITYKIYRQASGENGFKLLVESVTPSAEDLSILPDTTYTYYVKPYDAKAGTEGAESNRVAVEVTSELEETPTPTPTATPTPTDSAEPTDGLPPDNPDGGDGDQGEQTPDDGQQGPTDSVPPDQTPTPTPTSPPEATDSTGPVARATASPSMLPTPTPADAAGGKKNDNKKKDKDGAQAAVTGEQTSAP
ncbi:transglycosylase domain-containing protein [Cohnella sp. JJ-181]|uniref:transglycosylase domain-containing protein n=1 Tax=Cohnella rhizoplanae TaxID=2974897 RepID=UPI0022FF5B64|nr:PBP1A family penicillin-binding protein [Cohnella sp. JJ-181]CAI6081266.1 Penicillin-binding protein 1F [Cohnella sp. JJ-181]